MRLPMQRGEQIFFILNRAFSEKKYAIQFSEGGGVKGRLELFRKFIHDPSFTVHHILHNIRKCLDILHQEQIWRKNIASLRFQRGTPKKLHL